MTNTTGGLRRLSATGRTDRPDEVRRLWTRPSTWGTWDRGLVPTRLDGPFGQGARGEIVDRSGRSSTFVVHELEPGRRCAYHVRCREPGSSWSAPWAATTPGRSVTTSRSAVRSPR